jgi:hypothetical protein
MLFRSILDYLNRRPSTSPARRSARRPQSSRLWVEALENRCLPSFLAPVSYPVGTEPQAVVTADLNRDGKLDLITANLGGNSVNVQMGNGDGTFQAARPYATGAAPASVAVGDFNGDGKLDIVTANNQDNTVSVLLGNGDGTFQPAQSYATGSSPGCVAVGDFNGDGKLDLVTANYGDYGGNTVSMLMGNGDGTFGAAHSIALNAPTGPATAVAVGDFNADGKLDLAVTTAATAGTPGHLYYSYYGPIYIPGEPAKPAAVHVLLGNGDGSFTAGNSYFPPGGLPTSVVVADLNGDAKPDLVTADDYNSTVSVFLGNGNGTFQGPTSFNTGNSYTQSVAVADLNRDGVPDLVTADYADNAVSVLLGKGNGTFQTAQKFAEGTYPTSVAAGDFNGDGFADLAVANGGSNNVAILLNAADWPSFRVSGFPSPTIAGTASSFTVTVKNADGTTDTGYTGTIHFTSSDGKAILPADYTFSVQDAGTHAFSATLKTAGTQSITATDGTGAFAATDAGIIVKPAAASTMVVGGFPSPATAGVAGSFTVTMEDVYGNIASGYSGTVHFSSSDGKAVLPGNYTFTSNDAGAHTFSATLKTAGTQSITAIDTATGSLTGRDAGITVNPAAASKFILTAPATVNAGASFSLTLTVEDAYGNVVTNFTGTEHFSSTDKKATLPSNYTFTTADKGVHTFGGLVLRARGNQKITLTDTSNSSLTVSVILDVL